jgi:hypothetical protein
VRTALAIRGALSCKKANRVLRATTPEDPVEMLEPGLGEETRTSAPISVPNTDRPHYIK